MLAKDVMTYDVKTASAQTPVKDIARKMLEARISAIPIVGDTGRLVGIVSEGDLVRRPENETMATGAWWLSLFSNTDDRVGEFIKTHGRIAEDVMTKDVVTVNDDTPVTDIARILETKGIKRVPVLHDGRLIGIVSRANLLQGLAAGRLSIEDENDSSALRLSVRDVINSSPVKPYMVNVVVNSGVVELFGAVESNAHRDVLEKDVAKLPGVIEVKNNILITPISLRSYRG